MKKNKSITSDEVLLLLCHSVTDILNAAGNPQVSFSPMVQKIHKTCLRPDLGCFVLFDGGFSGLVIINFTAPAALEVYRKYMTAMGIPESELALYHTSDEVGNVLGELMNQIVGGFTNKVVQNLHTHINQSQPKMMAINQQLQILISTQLDQPQARRVTFTTRDNNIFYLELAMDKTEFVQILDVEQREEEHPDDIFASAGQAMAAAAPTPQDDGADDELLRSLGL